LIAGKYKSSISNIYTFLWIFFILSTFLAVFLLLSALTYS